MYQGLNENIETKDIVLSDLKNLDYKSFYSCYSIWDLEYQKRKEFPNKSEEEIKSEVKEEIKKETENYVKETKEKYYKINNEKTKELYQKFNQVKLKLNFEAVPKILKDGKFFTIFNGRFTLYDDKFLKKLYEIKFEANYNITSVIQLDNKDLVFLTDNLLIIYRLNEEKYFLFQKIEENQTGYHEQMSFSGCIGFPKTYKPQFLKEISGNRFICVSNYGFKMYSLNEKNEYSISLLEWYHEGLKSIFELDKNSFLFYSQINCGDSLGGPAHNNLIIDKIVLREITKTEKEDKLFEQSDAYRYYYGESEKYRRGKFTNEKDIKLINSLKFTYDYKQFIKYSTYGGFHYFKGNVILKNKYLLIGIDNIILIFDIFSGEELKRFKLMLSGNCNLYNCDANIKKWNNKEDNEFLINLNGNIVLFELTKDNDLKIINQSYYENVKYLKILNEKNNSFYDDGKKEDSRYGRYSYSLFFDCNDDNKNCSVTIFN